MEPRYTKKELTENKIVGVKLPQFKKPQWAVTNSFEDPEE